MNVEESARFFLEVGNLDSKFDTMFFLSSKIPQFKPMYAIKFISLKTKIIYEGFFKEGEGGLRAPETMSPLGVIKPKAMKNDKGREGGHKFGKMCRRRLWMAP